MSLYVIMSGFDHAKFEILVKYSNEYNEYKK
jgi:hypothetical protein